MTGSPMLLCYDIRDPRRLARVYRKARRAGIALQYSVFYLETTKAQLNILLEEITALIDESEDDVRVYNIGGLSEIQQFGENILPQGLFLGGDKSRLCKMIT